MARRVAATHAPTEINITMKLQPKQRELLSLYEKSANTIIGYGGARGGGKSHIGRLIMIWRRMKYANTTCYIIRKTLDDLRDNHLRPLLQRHPELEPYYKQQEKVLEFPNGSIIRFISAEHDEDIFRLAGKEADDIFIDQAEQFRREHIEFLTTINRGTGNQDIVNKMLLTFNPGGVGHEYLKRIFLKQRYEDNEDPEAFLFLRAYGWDNVEWCRLALKEDALSVKQFYSWGDAQRKEYFVTRSVYGRKLNQLPDSQRKAMLDGDFDVFEGQFFSMWRHARHVIPVFYPMPQGWNVVGGLDYGQRTVLEICARDYESRFVVCGECYTEHMTPIERATVMADYLLRWMERMNLIRPLRIVYDTNMDINLREYIGYDKTPAQVFRDIFRAKMGDLAPQMVVVSKNTTDRRGFRIVTNEMVKNALYYEGDARPNLVVTADCKSLIETMPELISDPTSQEGLDFDQGIGMDDPYDALKMAMFWLQAPRPGVKSYRQREYDSVEKIFGQANDLLVRVQRRMKQSTNRHRTI